MRFQDWVETKRVRVWKLRNGDDADYMNRSKYYTEAGPKLADQIRSKWVPEECLKNINTSFEFEFIPEAWVQKLITDIKMSKSSAVDKLSSRLLKDAFFSNPVRT